MRNETDINKVIKKLELEFSNLNPMAKEFSKGLLDALEWVLEISDGLDDYLEEE